VSISAARREWQYTVLPGGQRVLELLGPEDNTRARTFDSLRTTGVTVQLTWQSFQYDVVLRVFRASYKNPWWISYTVGLIVVRNGDGTPVNLTSPASPIQADILAAIAALQLNYPLIWTSQ